MRAWVCSALRALVRSDVGMSEKLQVQSWLALDTRDLHWKTHVFMELAWEQACGSIGNFNDAASEYVQDITMLRVELSFQSEEGLRVGVRVKGSHKNHNYLHTALRKQSKSKVTTRISHTTKLVIYRAL